MGPHEEPERSPMEKLTRVGVDYADRLAALWAETFHQAYGSLHTEENIRAYCATHLTPGTAEGAMHKVHCINHRQKPAATNSCQP